MKTHPHTCLSCGAIAQYRGPAEDCLHAIDPICRACSAASPIHPTTRVASHVDGVDYSMEDAMRLLFPATAAKMYDPGKWW